MRILALNSGKYKSVACDYEAESGEHSFATIATNLSVPSPLFSDAKSRII